MKGCIIALIPRLAYYGNYYEKLRVFGFKLKNAINVNEVHAHDGRVSQVHISAKAGRAASIQINASQDSYTDRAIIFPHGQLGV